jgi:anti-sigma factor RsiW
MRCRDARKWLGAQRDGDLTPSDASALEQHLQQCSTCHAFERHQRHLEMMFGTSAPRMRPSISTDHIMLAVQTQRRITQQLEEIQQQQQTRIARLRSGGTAVAAILFFTLGSIPLLVLAITIIQTDLVVRAISPLNGVIDVLIIIGQYLHMGLLLMTHNNWLLSGAAFAVVVMMAMWLRLMRYPAEA